MNKKIMLTVLGASVLFSFVSAQERVLQPLPTSITPVDQTQTGDVDPNGASSSCLNLGTDLRFKMKDTVVGGDVSDLQDFLISANLMQGESTGYFGAGTLKAVKLFQQRQGLKATGFVGAFTRAKVNTLSCSGQVANLGDGTQGSKPQRLMPDGSENDLPKGYFDASSTFPGMLNGVPGGRNNDGKQGGEMKQLPPEASVLMSYVSDTDKATLKAKEDAAKSADDILNTYYLSVRGGTMTDDVKVKLSSLGSAAKQAHKDLEDTKKSILDNLKSTLTDAQKQKIESTMKLMRGNSQGGDASSTRPEKKEAGDKRGKLDKKQMMPQPGQRIPFQEEEGSDIMGGKGVGASQGSRPPAR